MAAEPILELKNVYASYGRIKALKGTSSWKHPRSKRPRAAEILGPGADEDHPRAADRTADRALGSAA